VSLDIDTLVREHAEQRVVGQLQRGRELDQLVGEDHRAAGQRERVRTGAAPQVQRESQHVAGVVTRLGRHRAAQRVEGGAQRVLALGGQTARGQPSALERLVRDRELPVERHVLGDLFAHPRHGEPVQHEHERHAQRGHAEQHGPSGLHQRGEPGPQARGVAGPLPGVRPVDVAPGHRPRRLAGHVDPQLGPVRCASDTHRHRARPGAQPVEPERVDRVVVRAGHRGQPITSRPAASASMSPTPPVCACSRPVTVPSPPRSNSSRRKP